MLFTQLGLCEPILKAIEDQGYTSPTPIQAQAIPIVLQRKDVLAGAQTGTGKTAGFTLPLLELLNQNPTKGKPKVRALILTPTRELAAQVAESIETYGKYLSFKSCVIFGGVGINPQKAILKKGVDIVTATPGRLLDLMSQGSINLSDIECLILDEADRMLDMGFIHDIKRILKVLPKDKQTLLFSATFSDEIKKLSDGLLHQPELIEVARRNTSSEQIKQIIHYVDKDTKKALLTHLIHEEKWTQVLVFTRTKHGANKLSEHLNKNFILSAAIHGNKSQGARTKALADFKAGKIKVLVATDIAARGIDIDLLPHVVNFELPNVPEDYVHRIGRTGRAGNNGVAMSLVCGEEMQMLEDIETLIKKDVEVIEIDDFTSVQKKVSPPKQGGNRGNQRGNSKPRNDRGGRTNADRKHSRNENGSSRKEEHSNSGDSRNRNDGRSRNNDSRANSNDSRNRNDGRSRNNDSRASSTDSRSRNEGRSRNADSRANSNDSRSRNEGRSRNADSRANSNDSRSRTDGRPRNADSRNRSDGRSKNNDSRSKSSFSSSTSSSKDNKPSSKPSAKRRPANY